MHILKTESLMFLILIKIPYRILVESFALHVHFTCVGFNCQRKAKQCLVEYSLNTVKTLRLCQIFVEISLAVTNGGGGGQQEGAVVGGAREGPQSAGKDGKTWKLIVVQSCGSCKIVKKS